MSNSNYAPFRLLPVPKNVLWGGTRLKECYNKTADFDRIAESWELTLRPDGENIAANGIWKGLPLSKIIETDPQGILGTSFNSGTFPLLIKFIDARDNLSVQVHPDDHFAMNYENELGKTEMWYIAEAEEGAQLVLGLKKGCTISEFAEAVEKGHIESMLNYADVKKGDIFFIPPGTVHAIGGGILLAEIQQNSNVTYRVYDYNRRQADGTLRTLHTEKALAVMKNLTEEEIQNIRFKDGSIEPSLLASCSYFKVHHYDGENDTFYVQQESFAHLLVLDADHASLKCGGESYTIAKGDSWFLPANLGSVAINGKADVLVTTLP